MQSSSTSKLVDFEKVARLGSGSFGEVFSVRENLEAVCSSFALLTRLVCPRGAVVDVSGASKR